MNMFWGIMIPFIGTALGAAGVFFLKKSICQGVQKILFGFSAGVMAAACVWSLLIPAMSMAQDMGIWSFLPAVIGFSGGIVFLLLLGKFLPLCEAQESRVTRRLLWSVTLHNLPEGMAVGVAFAGAAAQGSQLAFAGAFTLAVGIAVQNIPEGTIISLPLGCQGMKKGRAFLIGLLSGVIEPVGAVFTIMLSQFILPVLPYLLAFSAGAMMSVVVSDLVPESVKGNGNMGVISFGVGFLIMMTLDVVLG